MPNRRVAVESLENRVLLSVSAEALAAAGYAQTVWQGQEVYAKPGEWVLQLAGVRGQAPEQLARVNQILANANVPAQAVQHLGADGVVLIKAPADLNHGQLRAQLAGAPGFQLIEPNFALWLAATPNDPSFSSQWGLHNTGQTGGTFDADIDAVEAWDLSRGNGSVVVGVIDSGIDYRHPDLVAARWVNPGEIAGNGADDDGNGYVDDVYGWDFRNNDSDPMDDNGHGTHVAGTIAAAGNNGVGVTGVAWSAKVMALKFLGADGTGSLSGAVAAVNYATKMRTTYGVDVRMTNNSWGGGGYSSTLYNAIRSSGDAGMLFIAAAGNGGSDQVGDNNDSAPSYPSSYDLSNIIAVAATDHQDRLGYFSNYGYSSVDLAAPGVSILSTTRGGGYGGMSGTSMAAPHVAGAAALAWSYRPDASVATIRNALLTSTDAKTSLSGKVASGGRLNVHQALQKLTVQTVPAAPSALSATAVSSSQVDLAWTDGSGNEDGFQVLRSSDGVNYTQIATVAANTTRYSNTGLAASTSYSYLVRAFNVAGTSATSNTATATTLAAPTAPTTPTNPVAVPSAPANLVARALSSTQVALTWSDTSSNEDGFRIERSTNGNKWSVVANVGRDSTSYTDSKLRKTTSYQYRIVAYNSAGSSAYSNTSSVTTLANGMTASAAPAAAAVTSESVLLSSWQHDVLQDELA